MGDERVIAGRYRLVERIGSGGAGIVWRAVDEQFARPVAMKHARISAASSERKLRREARLAASIDHVGVVACYDVVRDAGEVWLVQEYVPARSLAAVLASCPLGHQQTAIIGMQLAAALAAVHERGVVHRDVKPANVLLSEDGIVKLADFGISRCVAGDETVTDAPLVIGTPGYLAPEVARGELPTSASDVFSLGATLFAAVEGTPMFDGETQLSKIRRAAEADLPVTRRAGPLASALARMLASDPADRPSAAEIHTTLAELADGTPWKAPRRTHARRRWQVAGIAACVTAVASGVILLAPLASPPAAQPGAVAAPDPCGLADPSALRKFGTPELDTAYGNFDRCDVLVRRGGDAYTDVKIELRNAQASPPEGPRMRSGAYDVVTGPHDAGACGRLIPLPDGHLVAVTADDDPGTPEDLCAIANTAVASATHILTPQAVLPRRTAPFPAHSLATLNACTLLDPSDFASTLAMRDPHGVPTFGNWGCTFTGSDGENRVRVIFDRGGPLADHDGAPSVQAGHDTRVLADDYGPGTCRAKIAYRAYTDADNATQLELVLVVVDGPGPAQKLCAPTTTLAGDVAKRLS